MLAFMMRNNTNNYSTPCILRKLDHGIFRRSYQTFDTASVHSGLLSHPARHPHGIRIKGGCRGAARLEEERTELFDALCGDDCW